jgi:hypothetical protein
MSRPDPGLQYPQHLIESNPDHAALKMVFDNLFALRRQVASLPTASQMITQQQIKQLITQTLTNTVTNLGGSAQTGTHAIRLTTPAALGGLFYEEDRDSLYIGSDFTGPVVWTWVAGDMVGAIASIPGDLGTPDLGFIFTENDTGKETQYTWIGSKFVTTGGYLQQLKNADTNIIKNVRLKERLTSGAATTGFGMSSQESLQDSGAVSRVVYQDSSEWSSPATNNVIRRFSIRLAGVLTEFIDWAAAGLTLLVGNFIWFSGTLFTGTLVHNNTANRTYTYPDSNGNLTIDTSGGFVATDIVVGVTGEEIKDSGVALPPVLFSGTVVLESITPGFGTNGSLTVVNGFITAYVPPT